MEDRSNGSMTSPPRVQRKNRPSKQKRHPEKTLGCRIRLSGTTCCTNSIGADADVGADVGAICTHSEISSSRFGTNFYCLVALQAITGTGELYLTQSFAKSESHFPSCFC
jgi:hypothetical protein